MITKKLGSYELNIVEIENFKSYYYENQDKFSNVAKNSFLKALDIPPKFFKEQPQETQDELLENRETFIREHKKYFDKVIVVLLSGDNSEILNACRMSKSEEELRYKQLQTIEEVDKFEHRSFIKDSYISYVVSDKIENNKDNKVLVIDFPILLNKTPVIHEALYTLPNESFATPVEHIQYLSSEEVLLGYDYTDIAAAIEDHKGFITEPLNEDENAPILRETEVVSLALVEGNYIPKNYRDKVEAHIRDNVKGDLTFKSLESLVLDYDEEFRSYKQVRNLRSIKGLEVQKILESDNFKNLLEELDSIQESVTEELLEV